MNFVCRGLREVTPDKIQTTYYYSAQGDNIIWRYRHEKGAPNFEGIPAIWEFFHKFWLFLRYFRNLVPILDFFCPFWYIFDLFVNFVAHFGNIYMLWSLTFCGNLWTSKIWPRQVYVFFHVCGESSAVPEKYLDILIFIFPIFPI